MDSSSDTWCLISFKTILPKHIKNYLEAISYRQTDSDESITEGRRSTVRPGIASFAKFDPALVLDVATVSTILHAVFDGALLK